MALRDSYTISHSYYQFKGYNYTCVEGKVKYLSNRFLNGTTVKKSGKTGCSFFLCGSILSHKSDIEIIVSNESWQPPPGSCVSVGISRFSDPNL